MLTCKSQSACLIRMDEAKRMRHKSKRMRQVEMEDTQKK
jgi:hypothetical protein